MKSPHFEIASRCSIGAFALALLTNCAAPNRQTWIDPFEPVNPFGAEHVVVPVNQMLTPAGRQVELPGLRPQALALSPDGKILAVSGKSHELVLVDPIAGNIL